MNEHSHLLLITLFFISVICTCSVVSASDRISFEFPLEIGDSIYFEDGYYKVTLVGTEWQFGWAVLNISCDGCLYEPREVYGRKNETIHYPTTDSPMISITNTRDVSRDSARVTISFPEHWSYKLVTGEEVAKVEIRGDVNGDTQITSADAAIVLQIAVGSRLCNPETLVVADVSGDGRVSSLDALMILQQAG